MADELNRQRPMDQDLRRPTSFTVRIIGRVVPITLAQQIEVDKAGQLSDVAAELCERGGSVAVAGAPRQLCVEDLAEPDTQMYQRARAADRFQGLGASLGDCRVPAAHRPR